MDKKLSLIINKVAEEYEIDPYELGQIFGQLWKDVGMAMNSPHYPSIYISKWGRFKPSRKKIALRIEIAYSKLKRAQTIEERFEIECYIDQMENALKRLEHERRRRKTTATTAD